MKGIAPIPSSVIPTPPLPPPNFSPTCSYYSKPSSHSYNLGIESIPSKSEAETAISALILFVHENSSTGSYLNRFQQILGCRDLGLLASNGFRRAIEAFSLLQAEPSIKRLVVSLATDKAVWRAIMSNEMVQKLIKSCECGSQHRPQISDGNLKPESESEVIKSILMWIANIARAKISELMLTFQSLADQVFASSDKERFAAAAAAAENSTDEKIKSSFLLAVVIILIILVARVS